MIGVQRSLHGHHAAANVHADRRRNDRPARRNHTANGCTHAPMHVWHGYHPLVDERQLRDIQKLLTCRVLKRDALGPRLDGYTVVRLSTL